jgi:hypothetical protein
MRMQSPAQMRQAGSRMLPDWFPETGKKVLFMGTFHRGSARVTPTNRMAMTNNDKECHARVVRGHDLKRISLNAEKERG